MDTQTAILEPTIDGKYVKVLIQCPNCERVNKSKKIRSDEPFSHVNTKCKCGVAGYDWSYEPMKVNGKYAYITSCASISASDMPKVVRFNEKNFHLTNYGG